MDGLPGDFQVLTALGGGVGTLTLEGELDMATLPRLEAAVQAAPLAEAPRLVVDLRALRFMDSMGLQFLLRLDAACREAGRQLVVVRGPRAVHRLFEVMEMESVLTMADAPPD
jgi:anti-sigma B factor antagonist